MPDYPEKDLYELLNFSEITGVETIQSLWSGYGSLDRVFLDGYSTESVIVKNIQASAPTNHPRGWNSDLGHQRKLKSYEVEANWYRHFNQRTNAACRTPQLLGYKKFELHTLLVLEDLDRVGYDQRRQTLTDKELHACLEWLAAFHARFMGQKPNGLWKIGTYWQLDTRQDEWEAMPSGSLKDHAQAIHQKLNNARHQTLVHGDAKYANFCFSQTGRVAAVDFQYVGKGCGIKDVAYLLSCIDGGPKDQRHEVVLLNHYFSSLKYYLKQEKSEVNFTELETEWRNLYTFAWADFERFLQGWSPGHWKSTGYAQAQVAKALSILN